MHRRPVIYLATSNPAKARELSRLIGREVAPVPGYVAPPEDGATYIANAHLKARAGRAAAPAGSWVLADDSGLEVEALGGEPGVLSARFGGAGLDDSGRNAALLDRLGPGADRAATFVCVLVALDPAGGMHEAQGRLSGRIAEAPRGSGGFGYDPLFVPDGERRAVAELSAEEKDALSHRGRAARALREMLRW